MTKVRVKVRVRVGGEETLICMVLQHPQVSLEATQLFSSRAAQQAAALKAELVARGCGL